jgi:hypothetical protein
MQRTWSTRTFIVMQADQTFDGQERVMSRAAYDLQVRATSHSAFCGHPGYVPDDYLSGLSTETTITAAELCAVGLWERDGHRLIRVTESRKAKVEMNRLGWAGP